MPDNPTDLERLKHIIEAIDKIYGYIENVGFEGFLANEMMQDAVIKNFEIIGEAANKISKELKDTHSSIEWSKIEGTRHVLVHDYYKIDPTVLWNTIENNFTDLRNDVMELIGKLTPSP